MTGCINRFFAIAAMLMSFASLKGQVKPGIEVLADGGFEQLRGKRVGLITNPTGIDSHFTATADILANADDVKVVAFFAPEHGIRGDVVAGAKVADSRDPKTGIRVYSLYGSSRKPTREMLRDIDVLVYDIQDNGCRSYTFISTMGKAMEAAAECGVEFMVLDRPNPLGGERVEGLIADEDCISFVSQYQIPYLYGLTPGELASMLANEGMIKGGKSLKLTVIPMEGWERWMSYADTSLPWVLPSPHIPASETCAYYAASGIVGELDFISIGVGYTLPFRTFAAPWIDEQQLADRLNDRDIPGIEFRPICYTPFYGKFKGTPVKGVEIFVTDPSSAQFTPVQFHLLEVLARMYPDRKPLEPTEKNKSNLNMFDKVVGSHEIARKLRESGYRFDSIVGLWNRDVEKFNEKKHYYHIY